MAKFIETESNEKKIMINLDQVQSIEPITDSNECVIRFASGGIEDIIVDEAYDSLIRKIGEMSKI